MGRFDESTFLPKTWHLYDGRCTVELQCDTAFGPNSSRQSTRPYGIVCLTRQMFSVRPSAVPVHPILKIDQGWVPCCALVEVPFPCCRVCVVESAGIGARGHPSVSVAPTWLNPGSIYPMSANGNVSTSEVRIGYVRGFACNSSMQSLFIGPLSSINVNRALWRCQVARSLSEH
jgi:hypothetical protein